MSAVNRLGDLVKSNLEAAFSRNEPDANRAATDGGKASATSNGRQGRSPGQAPFPREQGAWLRHLLEDTLTTMGSHIDERFQAVETTADAVMAAASANAEDIKALREEVAAAASSKRVAAEASARTEQAMLEGSRCATRPPAPPSPSAAPTPLRPTSSSRRS